MLAGSELGVFSKGAREAPGNNALYMSFLRGFPVPIRRVPEGVSDDLADNERDGGGMLLGTFSVG